MQRVVKGDHGDLTIVMVGNYHHGKVDFPDASLYDVAFQPAALGVFPDLPQSPTRKGQVW